MVDPVRTGPREESEAPQGASLFPVRRAKRVVRQCEQRNHSRVGSERPRPQTDRAKAVRAEQFELERVPPAFGADSEQHAGPGYAVNRVAHGSVAGRVGHQALGVAGKTGEFVLHQDTEPSMNTDLREEGVARLLQAFEEQRAIDSRFE